MLCQVKYTCCNNNNINKTSISRGQHIWHECQSNIWSSDTKTYMHLIITDRTRIIYSMYRADEVSVHRACCKRATQPYSLGGGGGVRFIQAEDQHVLPLRSSRMVAEYFFHSLSIN